MVSPNPSFYSFLFPFLLDENREHSFILPSLARERDLHVRKFFLQSSLYLSLQYQSSAFPTMLWVEHFDLQTWFPSLPSRETPVCQQDSYLKRMSLDYFSLTGTLGIEEKKLILVWMTGTAYQTLCCYQ
jgi:hypothetical protein